MNHEQMGGAKMITENLTPKQFCKKNNPCEEGRAFALSQPTMADAWDNCRRVDWMLWVEERLEIKIEPKTLRLFAVWCARNTPLSDGRKTGNLLKDPCSLAALEVAERYAQGNATDAEMRAGWTAAWTTAETAAWAAAQAAAETAARAAAGAAAGAAARNAAWAAARTAAEAAQADQLRKMITNPFKEGGRK